MTRHFGVTGRNALLTHIANVDERRYRVRKGRRLLRLFGELMAFGLLMAAILAWMVV